MSEYNMDELKYAVEKTGVNSSADDVATVLRYLSGPTHDQNDSAVIEGEEVNSDRVAMGGGFPTVMGGNATRRGEDLRNAVSEAQANDMADRDDQTGAVSSPKGTGNEASSQDDPVTKAQSVKR